MRVLILMGSPHAQGNTAALCRPLWEELTALGAQVEYVTLDDKRILPCRGCYACQHVAGEYGCALQDDMQQIARQMMAADVIILATPIYAWYCTTQMKAVLDRHYGMNKYYGSVRGSLWAGKSVALVVTHGYEGAYATDPFETGVERLCLHSKLRYLGMYAVRDTDDIRSFETKEAQAGARAFARRIVSEIK